MDEVERLLRERPIGKRRGNKREVIDGVSPQVLAEAGWGVIFPQSAGQAENLRKALGPLLTRRQEEAGDRYHEYLEGEGYCPKDDPVKFLQRQKASLDRVAVEAPPGGKE